MPGQAQAARIEASNAILALLTGTPAQKEAAAWVALREVMQGLDTIAPRTLTYPGMLTGVTVEQLKQALSAEDRPAIASVFSAWRADVLNLEAHNAARLGVLIGALARIRWLRERGFDPASLDRLEPAIVAQLRRAWHLEPPDPTLRDTRNWAMRQTLRRDLLPDSWRNL